MCRKGVMPMTVFEALMFAIAFASLIVSILSYSQKK
ncbi:putative holin-like toxin [Parageobacillus thermoglucosidasius]